MFFKLILDFNVKMSEESAEQVAWWLRWFTRGVGILGALSAGIGGILTFVLHIITPICIGAASLMLLLSFLMFIFEATICCGRISFAQPIISRIDAVKFWHKAGIYCAYV